MEVWISAQQLLAVLCVAASLQSSSSQAQDSAPASSSDDSPGIVIHRPEDVTPGTTLPRVVYTTPPERTPPPVVHYVSTPGITVKTVVTALFPVTNKATTNLRPIDNDTEDDGSEEDQEDVMTNDVEDGMTNNGEAVMTNDVETQAGGGAASFLQKNLWTTLYTILTLLFVSMLTHILFGRIAE